MEHGSSYLKSIKDGHDTEPHAQLLAYRHKRSQHMITYAAKSAMAKTGMIADVSGLVEGFANGNSKVRIR